jgi:hypothetical protein
VGVCGVREVCVLGGGKECVRGKEVFIFPDMCVHGSLLRNVGLGGVCVCVCVWEMGRERVGGGGEKPRSSVRRW